MMHVPLAPALRCLMGLTLCISMMMPTCQGFVALSPLHFSSFSTRSSMGGEADTILSDTTVKDPLAHWLLLRDRINQTLNELLLDGGEHMIQQSGNSFDLFDRQTILNEIDQQHQQQAMDDNDDDHDVDASRISTFLPSESSNDLMMAGGQDPPAYYDWIYSPVSKRPLAIETRGEPILDSTTIAWIRQEALAIWNNDNDDTKLDMASRFTYQRKGNYEVHLADLLKRHQTSTDGEVQKEAIHQALMQRVYPLIRKAFGKEKDLLVDDPSCLQLQVYDSIVIRYNASEAAPTPEPKIMTPSFSMGAGQPLHRDLGLVSVNIMLNKEDEFEGGGEDATTEPLLEPLKPSGGPGHALLHLSSDRHAGASTQNGVRDILVFFITATRKETNSKNDDGGRQQQQHQAPTLERAARLKSTARSKCQDCRTSFQSALCRAYYQYLAVESVPQDGEAWHYLGMALWDVYSSLLEMESSSTSSQVPVPSMMHQRLVQGSIDCLQLASTLTPCDARLYNNLALTLDKISQNPALAELLHIDSQDGDYFYDQISANYEKAIRLHEASSTLGGCDVSLDYDSALLNYGLYLANRDLFSPAVQILGSISCIPATQDETQKDRHEVILKDAQRLLHFCQRQLETT
eukprot:scaffold3955_cov160-Cylindrotheca_fusiformis.AAC.16